MSSARQCCLCKGRNLSLLFNLNDLPISHFLRKKRDDPDPRFSVGFECCQDCGLLQIVDPIPADLIYGEADTYTTGFQQPRHLDGPPHAADAELFGFADDANVFLKVTPLNFAPPDWGKASPESFLGKLIGEFGADRLAFGSNFPATAGTLQDILGKARAAFAFANSHDQALIFGGTAQRLYPMLAVG